MVTRGPNGAMVLSGAAPSHRRDAAGPVVDTTGAGDLLLPAIFMVGPMAIS